MGGALRRGLSKTFSKKRVAGDENNDVRRRTANPHDLLATANTSLSGRFWGVPLEQLLAQEIGAGEIPGIYSAVLDWLTEHAVTAEGIFRVSCCDWAPVLKSQCTFVQRSPEQAKLVRLRNFFETKGLSQAIPDSTDPYLVATLMKTLIGELPGTLLTLASFGEFADAAG